MNSIIKNAFVSWKTSLLGIVSFVLLNGPQIWDYFANHWNLDWRQLSFGFVLMLMGLIQRDGDKSSEQAGAAASTVTRMNGGLIPVVVLCVILCAGCTPTGKVNVSYDPVTGQPTINGGIEWKRLRDAQIAACKAASRSQMAANMAAFTAEQNRLCKQCKDCEIAEFVNIAGEQLPVVNPPVILPDNTLPESGTVDKGKK